MDNHFKPDEKFEFPRKLLHGCNRSFNNKWLKKYPFLAYSKCLDSAFCLPCVLFAPDEKKENSFTKLPGFSNWHKTGEKASDHCNSTVHIDSMVKSESFKRRFQEPQSTMPYVLDTTRQEKIERNSKIVKWIIKVTLLCGKQCIPLRGHRENVNNFTQNSGNFLAILRLLSETNDELKEHLRCPVARNATYLSPSIQNEIINIIAYDILQKDVVEEIKTAKFFAILADEVESHHIEQLPLCIRFVDTKKNIREEFLEFGRCTQVNGEAITNEILRILDKAGLEIKDCRGQGYDGASNMSSEAVGVQGRIKSMCEKAVYTHCCGHNLSLVVVSACKLPVVRNVLDKVKDVTQMFVKGSKKMNLLQEVVKQNPNYSEGQKVIFNVCVTRWVENLDGYNQFLLAYPYIVEALEVIAHKLHLEKYPTWRKWDTESRRRASGLLSGISNFEFCVVWTTMVKSLFYLRGPTKKIQGRSLDLYDVVGQVKIAREDLAFVRSDGAKIFFTRCFEYASQVAGQISIFPCMPRIAARQQHRANAESTTPYDYYRINMCLPFLDHLINGIDVRFDKYGQTVLSMAGLIPSVIAENDVLINDIVDMYRDDLPTPIHCQEEFVRWKRRWSNCEISLRPKTIAQALKHCDSDMYPNLSVLLQIAGTVAVTSCECERSGSVLKRLNTYLRASMGQERMSGLAFMHINYDVDIDVDRVFDVFTKKPRALEFSNICSQ